MRDEEELIGLVEKHLDSALGDLWDALEPEERRKVFPALIAEFVGSNY